MKPGVEGLVHISEMAHKHVETPHEIVAKDEEIEVKVLSVNPQEERVSLSIKALTENTESATAKEAPQQSSQNERPSVKQPSLRDDDDEGAFTLGDQIGDQLSGFMDNDSDED